MPPSDLRPPPAGPRRIPPRRIVTIGMVLVIVAAGITAIVQGPDKKTPYGITVTTPDVSRRLQGLTTTLPTTLPSGKSDASGDAR